MSAEFQQAQARLQQYCELHSTDWLLINIAEQKLYCTSNNQVAQHYPISTSRYGGGNQQDSWQTPLGVHRIAEKIGFNQPLGMIFKGRKPTGIIATLNTTTQISGDDMITSRILWLQGLEEGVNQGGDVDSYQRYIYIHGTADEGLIGQSASMGCIRMKNADVIELFDSVDENVLVVIL